MNLTELFTSIANAIRSKKGTTELINAVDFPSEIENLKTANLKITNASYLFYNGARIDYLYEFLSLCENIKSTQRMFSGCTDLTELNLINWDTSNVTDMSYMFYDCKAFTKLDLSNLNTSKVSTTYQMFYNCNKLTELDLSNLDMGKLTNLNYMFQSCTNLTTINSFKNLGKGYTKTTKNYSNYKLDLTPSKKISKESLIDIITNGLYDLNLTYDVANGGTLYTQQLNLGSDNLAKLNSQELELATSKGWTVS